MRLLCPVLVALLLLAAASLTMADSGRENPDAIEKSSPPRVLLFSKTTGYRHASIPEALTALGELAAEEGFAVEATEDASVFTPQTLSDYAAVAFVMTSGEVFDASQQAAFEDFIRGGGGFLGVHSASTTEYEWPWFGQLVGAWFAHHPAVQEAEIRVEDPDHPSTRMLPEIWSRRDEWYNFRHNPRDTVNVLLSLDESTYSGGTMGDHPIAWYHAFDGGRSWYTAGGHTKESYDEPLFRAHLRGGLRYAVLGLPPEVSLHLSPDAGGRVHLAIAAAPNRDYTVFRAPDATTWEASGTVSTTPEDGTAAFTEPLGPETAPVFYRVEAKP